MKQWCFIIDVSMCWDCNNCFITCKDEHEGNDWPGYSLAQPSHGQRWIDVYRHERGQYPLIDVAYRPTPCMHCRNAPCVEASNGSISRRDDGIVLIDPQKSIGRKDLLDACPYGVIFWNEDQNIPQKCTLCAHLLDEGWAQPRCVQACFAGALKVEMLEEDEIARKVKNENLQQLYPEWGTSPRVYYKHLYRFDKAFISGSAAVKVEGIIDCAHGASVKLFSGANLIQEALTDAFGDFRFDGLDNGSYIVEVDAGTEKISETVTLNNDSRNLGIIQI